MAERIIGSDTFQALARHFPMDKEIKAYLQKITLSNFDVLDDDRVIKLLQADQVPFFNLEQQDDQLYDEITSSGNLKIKKLKVHNVWQDANKRLRKFVIGKSRIGERERNIILVGATGSGKSTLIDAMANYIIGVKWENDYRLRIVHMSEDEQKQKSQAHSQTQWITVYSIPSTADTKINYTLNIVDTPGFGDTRGIERDQELADQIKHFFSNPESHGIDCIDAICFLVQAPLARLTHAQKYIFDAILSIFGKDVADNIFAMITFADGKKPPVIASLDEANVPYKKAFRFNNSALFSPTKPTTDEKDEDDSDDEDFGKMFWELGVKSAEKFFQNLCKTSPKSLTLTSQVLRKREELQNSVEHLKARVEEGCLQLNKLKEEKEILEKYAREVDENKDFVYEVHEVYSIKKDVPGGNIVTNCIVCHVTCHANCNIPNDKDKHECIAIQDGKCTRCEKKCNWDCHYNQGYIFTTETRKVKKTYFEMKHRYQFAQTQKVKKQELIELLEKEYKSLENEIGKKIVQARGCLSELQVTALKPDHLTDEGYLDLLIHEEQMHGKPGWQQRVGVLLNLKRKAKLIEGVQYTMEGGEFIDLTKL